MRRLPRLILASAVLLGTVFLGCQETLPPEPPDPNPNGDQRTLLPPRGEPFVIIDTPTPPPNLTATVMLGRVIVFEWHSGLEVDPQSVRWLCMQVVETMGNYNPTFDIVGDLNLHPERYESKWSSWIPYANPDGRATTVGKRRAPHIEQVLHLRRAGEESLRQGHDGIQSGSEHTAVRRSATAAPRLIITEPFIGSQVFLGMNPRPATVSFPTGLEMTFSWKADASSYGGRIVGYRYGWDVSDIRDDNDWMAGFSPLSTHAFPIALQSGVHTLFVEAIDNGRDNPRHDRAVARPLHHGKESPLGGRFPLTNDFQQIDYMFPREDEHDDFWLGLGVKAAGFDASRDAYDVSTPTAGCGPISRS